jgi:acetylornithine/succinyldiaminopimelate/putrescine aminotransferase
MSKGYEGSMITLSDRTGKSYIDLLSSTAMTRLSRSLTTVTKAVSVTLGHIISLSNTVTILFTLCSVWLCIHCLMK